LNEKYWYLNHEIDHSPQVVVVALEEFCNREEEGLRFSVVEFLALRSIENQIYLVEEVDELGEDGSALPVVDLRVIKASGLLEHNTLLESLEFVNV
jgi:hypothetical protein